MTTSNGRVVKAHEALSSSRSELFIETTIIALAHIAIYSEQLEFEVFQLFLVLLIKNNDSILTTYLKN